MEDIPLPLKKQTVHGRGTGINPVNRFEQIVLEENLEDNEEELSQEKRVPTHYFKDTSRTIIATNDSPDIGFEASINPYRGCEHGCIYCYARPTHEYFGLSSGLDFETKIFVKEDAPQLLRKELSKKSWIPKTIIMSGVTDCYQPVERKLQLTRRCLEVLHDFRNPAFIITKNQLVTRDIDILKQMSEYHGVGVLISLTTLDEKIWHVMEPRTSKPSLRLKAITKLHEAGIPVGVNAAPIIPGLTDVEIPSLLKAAVGAGAQFAGYTVVRLPHSVKELFEEWLVRHFPDRKEKVLNRLRSLRGGKLYKSEWGKRMTGEGIFADQIQALFEMGCKKAGLPRKDFHLATDSFRNPEEKQFMLFS
jgi:DNA repair photolyase